MKGLRGKELGRPERWSEWGDPVSQKGETALVCGGACSSQVHGLDPHAGDCSDEFLLFFVSFAQPEIRRAGVGTSLVL